MPQTQKRARSPPTGKQQVGADGALPAPDMSKWLDIFPAPEGPIDTKYDLHCGRAALEWWYFNCHLTSGKTNQKISLFASFFAQADLLSLDEEEFQSGKEYDFFHACTWALTDVENDKYHADSLLDKRSQDRLLAKLDPKNTGRKCVHAEGALLEMVQKGRVPLPDRLMKKPAVLTSKDGYVYFNLDDHCVVKGRAPRAGELKVEGSAPIVYEVSLYNPHKDVKAELTFVPEREFVRHGLHGVVNEMFYYYVPRMEVTGTVWIRGVEHPVSGSGWYDREFGGSRDDTGKDALDAWTWFSCQLSNNTEFSFFNVVDKDTQAEKEKVAVVTTKGGERKVATDVSVTFSNMWTSLNTYLEYPMCWKVTSASLDLELYINCAVTHQEFMTVIVTGGGFYEGKITFNGSMAGKEITGQGYLERKNHVTYKDTAGLLKNIGRFVKKTLSDMYPMNASQQWVNENVLGRHATKTGSDAARVCETIFKPVRALIDRGGKSWRSLILVSSVSALSTDYFDCSKYIAISELLHVGSLIIDDIQDESSVRRGGKTVHLEYGTATAINAGTACYFMAPLLAGVKTLSPPKQLAVYDLYFDVLRSGHAGQGLDIAGLDSLMPHAVETGDTDDLFKALQAIHIYKTGGAAGTLCKMACVICDATDAQSFALENFGTQIGLAFQIVDDALNLRGFEGDLKEVGEDIRDGKVTYPVIKALGRLSKEDREYIWTILQEKTDDQGKIQSVISKLNSVSAIQDCLVEARDLVENSWELVDKELPDTLPKIMMRTFCGYLTERTY